ncbi:MAG: AMP-binding protein, partial [Lachnospiraceae bacterium]|nr:AMP-binding protein [Lachnospiraceae bacterium]
MNGYRKNYPLDKKFHEFPDLRAMLRESADKYGEKTAFITKVKIRGKEASYINTSYRDLLEEVNMLGTALLSLGLKDTRIALIGENSYKWILSYLASCCGVGVIVPLDKLMQKEELTGLLKRSRAKAVFCDEKHSREVSEIMASGETELELLIGLDYIPENGISILDLLDLGREKLAAGDT